jgi:hypothetical protein
MKTDRRKFLKYSGLTGIGIAGAGMIRSYASENDFEKHETYSQHFNMCGYAAPKLEIVRIGFVGLGNRGPTHVDAMKHIEGTEIKALCDISPEKANAAKKMLEGTSHSPTIYTDSADAWKKMCEQPDIDAVWIATPWSLHVPIAVYAMEHGKHVFIEVPAAKTLDECWQLVETSERTRKHCMILENCCYDFFELLTSTWFGKVCSAILCMVKVHIFIIFLNQIFRRRTIMICGD